MLLLVFTAGFLFFMYIFTRPFLLGTATMKDLIYVSPLFAFILVWYVVVVRIALWRAFGVEQITVEHGVLSWIRTALFWIRKFEIPTAEITSVKAITPWHALSNRVEFTTSGHRQRIGDMLLHNEATELAHELCHAIGSKNLAEHS